MQYLVLLPLLIALITTPLFAAESSEEVLSISVERPPIKYENVIETVIIDNQPYQVPEPWTGNRLFPTSRNLDELVQIPREHTHKESEIYILAEAHDPLLRMLEQARFDGVDLKVESAYRSMGYQTRIFVRMLNKGRTFDDIVRYVAPPGYSQHMLGTAMDFYPSNWEFAETEQYRWLQENGLKFGFAETYSKNNRYRMPWEAWHWNYIGEPDIVAESPVEDADQEDEESVLTEAAQSTVTEESNIVERDLSPSEEAGSTLAEGAWVKEEEILSN